MSLIDPCKMAVSLNLPSSYDKDKQGYINSTVLWYLNKYVYIKGANCVPKQNLTLTSLNIQITQDLPVNGKLIPDDLQDTNENYNLTIDNSSVSIAAGQWSGLVRGISTLA